MLAATSTRYDSRANELTSSTVSVTSSAVSTVITSTTTNDVLVVTTTTRTTTDTISTSVTTTIVSRSTTTDSSTTSTTTQPVSFTFAPVNDPISALKKRQALASDGGLSGASRIPSVCTDDAAFVSACSRLGYVTSAPSTSVTTTSLPNSATSTSTALSSVDSTSQSTTTSIENAYSTTTLTYTTTTSLLSTISSTTTRVVTLPQQNVFGLVEGNGNYAPGVNAGLTAEGYPVGVADGFGWEIASDGRLLIFYNGPQTLRVSTTPGLLNRIFVPTASASGGTALQDLLCDQPTAYGQALNCYVQGNPAVKTTQFWRCNRMGGTAFYYFNMQPAAGGCYSTTWVVVKKQ